MQLVNLLRLACSIVLLGTIAASARPIGSGDSIILLRHECVDKRADDGINDIHGLPVTAIILVVTRDCLKITHPNQDERTDNCSMDQKNEYASCTSFGGEDHSLPLRCIEQKAYYTYIGTDFPSIHPSIMLNPASLTLQESVRYSGNKSDPITSNEWNSLMRYPRGLGHVILGPEHRAFLVTFYHQLHCIREVEKGLFNRDDPEATLHHMKHCMDYLRQTLLCSAVDSLEEGDFLERDFNKQRTEVIWLAGIGNAFTRDSIVVGWNSLRGEMIQVRKDV
ncbi:hypothetical protein CPB84DRAFT_1749885 [Gymnopilus junonius]|uniref:Uncharacterized protein n=1 Tax=Gymnopilus junonius TaxID=109634 RepID=A0A9P5TKC4_GYMJU|nr:hypothetical protein CPB84DRAFT_1749885 [Gymnopilus junonius]